MNGTLKYHGGKHYLAHEIVALMPGHMHYVEPYAGGLAVLFAKPWEGTSEVVNDLNGDLTNFWRVLQDRKSFADFRRRVEAIPFSETEWQEAREPMELHRDPSGWSGRSASSSCAGSPWPVAARTSHL
jgi:DNA adenine methylase